MSEILNKFLLAGDNFIPDMYLKQPGFTFSACEPITKNKQRIKKTKETGDTKYICRNDLDKACFQNDLAYGDFLNLGRRTVSDKVLKDKAFNIAKNRKYDGYRRGLPSIVYKFFDKKSVSLIDKSAKGGSVNNEIKQNEQLGEKLHKPIIKKIKKRKIYSSFKDNMLVLI